MDIMYGAEGWETKCGVVLPRDQRWVSLDGEVTHLVFWARLEPISGIRLPQSFEKLTRFELCEKCHGYLAPGQEHVVLGWDVDRTIRRGADGALQIDEDWSDEFKAARPMRSVFYPDGS